MRYYTKVHVFALMLGYSLRPVHSRIRMHSSPHTVYLERPAVLCVQSGGSVETGQLEKEKERVNNTFGLLTPRAAIRASVDSATHTLSCDTRWPSERASERLIDWSPRPQLQPRRRRWLAAGVDPCARVRHAGRAAAIERLVHTEGQLEWCR